MPPTAFEIKARLDKAVDQEGNVLNMEVVLEIVAALEKLNMTTEALEATRIGRIINFMRKKTTNKELSKRLKKLVQKWQALVSNKFKLKSDSPINFTSSSPSTNINGTIKRTELLEKTKNGKERPSSCSPDGQPRKGKKRKLTSAENSPLNLKPISSPQVKNHSPKLHIKTSSTVSHSPKSNIRSNSPVVNSFRNNSPKLVNRIHSPNLSLVNANKVKPSSSSSAANSNKKSENNRTISKELTANSNAFNDTNLNTKSDKIQNILPNDSETITLRDYIDIEKSTDTRIQENRIENLEIKNDKKEIYKNETNLNLKEYSEDMKEKNENEIIKDENLVIKEETKIEPKVFEPIEAEELSIIRKELPENILEITSHADGINGVFASSSNNKIENEANKDEVEARNDEIDGNNDIWYDWTEIIPQRNNEIHLLPYVILD